MSESKNHIRSTTDTSFLLDIFTFLQDIEFNNIIYFHVLIIYVISRKGEIKIFFSDSLVKTKSHKKLEVGFIREKSINFEVLLFFRVLFYSLKLIIFYQNNKKCNC